MVSLFVVLMSWVDCFVVGTVKAVHGGSRCCPLVFAQAAGEGSHLPGGNLLGQLCCDVRLSRALSTNVATSDSAFPARSDVTKSCDHILTLVAMCRFTLMNFALTRIVCPFLQPQV